MLRNAMGGWVYCSASGRCTDYSPIHVNPEGSFGGTNGEPTSEGGSGDPPPENLKKPILQMVQSTLFLSYICEYY